MKQQMKQNHFSNKLFLIMFILSFFSILIALISQHFFDMQPCAWCVIQRLLFFLIGIISLIGFFLNKVIISRIFALLIAALGIVGILAACLQKIFSSDDLSCTTVTAADKIISNSGFDSAIPWLFNIYASCADDPVTLFGIEYFILSLSVFVLLILISFSICLKKE
ncbi:disulfide bond formation protein B [Candidatus Kinetoplastidibacterium crithidiae]|uniref:disulfide bond formation protein B n=1 Tax=Candidatus Kinetoplastidibacterium crithidiae TaxID=33056 RepID=UPI001CEF8A53|nr:disulfide bond formation protein B [Candidatus Kinetoplastibacterium crithidii]